MLHHYVFMKYLEDASNSHIDGYCQKMFALKELIPGIEHIEIGRDCLHDARSWDLILYMKFESVETLRRYQKHPEHQAVMKYNDPFVAQVGSVDFEKP